MGFFKNLFSDDNDKPVEDTFEDVDLDRALITYLAGVTYEGREDIILEEVKRVRDNVKFQKYDGLKGKELREELEYHDVFEIPSINLDVKFESEPDNQHDPNAVKVIFEDTLIGYVPKDETRKAKALIHHGNYKAKVTVSTGKYKTLYYDYDTDKETILNKELDKPQYKLYASKKLF